MCRIFSVFALLFSMNTILIAQNPAKAKEILVKSSQKYLAYQSLQGSFKYILIDKIKKKELSKKGSFKLKGDKYHLTIENPDVIVFYNGKKRVMYRVEEKEYEYLENDEAVPFHPQDLLKNYARDYHYTMGKDEEVQGQACYSFTLIPKKNKENTNQLKQLSDSKVKIELFINQKTLEIQKMVSEESNGQQMVLEIFSLKTNAPLPESDFDFDPKNYPGAEEI